MFKYLSIFFIVLFSFISAQTVLTQVDIIAGYGSGQGQGGIDVGTVTVSVDNQNLYVIYETEATLGEDGNYHDWILTECHVWVAETAPTERGQPGHYPYNSGPINTMEYTFTIPLSELEENFGITWGDIVYMMTHCALYYDENDNNQYDEGEQTETGYGYRPPNAWIGGQPWYGYFWFELVEPQPEAQPWPGKTFTPGYWKNHPSAFAGYLPVTIAGVNVTTVNQALSILSNPSAKVAWNSFLCHLLATTFNACYDTTLLNAYYNDTSKTGEFMENYTVGAILNIANGYNQNTPRATLLAMKDVLDAINNNGAYIVLWTGQQSLITSPLNNSSISIYPNPFAHKTTIQFVGEMKEPLTIDIYNSLGKKVQTLKVKENNLVWNANTLPRGLYILKVRNTNTQIKAIITH